MTTLNFNGAVPSLNTQPLQISSPAGGQNTPSVNLTAGTPGYEALLEIAQSAQSLLGLATPLSASDVAALLGEVTSNLRQILALDQENADQSDVGSISSKIETVLQLIGQDQAAAATQAAAQAQESSDESQLFQARGEIRKANSDIVSRTGNVAALQTEISSLSKSANPADQQALQTDQNELTLQLNAISADKQTIATAATQANALSADIASQQTIIQNAISSQAQDESTIAADLQDVLKLESTSASGSSGDAAMNLLTTTIDDLTKISGELLISGLKTDQAQALVSDALAAYQAILTLGVLLPQAGGYTPQNVSGANAV